MVITEEAKALRKWVELTEKLTTEGREFYGSQEPDENGVINKFDLDSLFTRSAYLESLSIEREQA